MNINNNIKFLKLKIMLITAIKLVPFLLIKNKFYKLD